MYCNTIVGPSATRQPSTASVKACTMCGEFSKILGHTKLNRCINASSQPNPYTPNAMCFTAQHAVCLCTRSLNNEWHGRQWLQYFTRPAVHTQTGKAFSYNAMPFSQPCMACNFVANKRDLKKLKMSAEVVQAVRLWQLVTPQTCTMVYKYTYE